MNTTCTCTACPTLSAAIAAADAATAWQAVGYEDGRALAKHRADLNRSAVKAAASAAAQARGSYAINGYLSAFLSGYGID